MSATMSSVADVDLWRTILNEVKAQLTTRIVDLDERTVSDAAFGIMHGLESKGFGIVPMRPTNRMLTASMAELSKGPIRHVWVSEKAKHRMRLVAACRAAPNWKAGFEAEREAAREGKPSA